MICPKVCVIVFLSLSWGIVQHMAGHVVRPQRLTELTSRVGNEKRGH